MKLKDKVEKVVAKVKRKPKLEPEAIETEVEIGETEVFDGRVIPKRDTRGVLM